MLGKVIKFLVEKLSTSDVIRQKLQGGGVENTTPHGAFRAKGFKVHPYVYSTVTLLWATLWGDLNP